MDWLGRDNNRNREVIYMKIVFLHLSDMHIRTESDISDLHLTKIVESLNCYKDIEIKNVVIIISGDLTEAGTKNQFINASKIIGTIIRKIKNAFGECSCNVLPVPGNHDVFHNGNYLTVAKLKKDGYTSLEVTEHSKLEQFYVLSKFNKCFANKEIYSDKKIIDINGFKIQANLINNAIFSTYDENAEYKSL
jgi:DNA repair exonuclease SbcCD nuclease subunit